MNDVAPILNIDYTIFSFLVIALLMIVSRLNVLYEEHLGVLLSAKDVTRHMGEYQRHYFKCGSIKTGFLGVQNDFMYDKEINDPVLNYYIARIKSIYPLKQISSVLKQANKAWSDVFNHVEKEKILLKIEILTFPVNASLLIRAFGLMIISAMGGLAYWIQSAKSSGEEPEPQ